MKDSEIVKALECCVSSKHICPHTCPMLKNGECLEILRKNALDLINRLQCERNKYRRKVQNQREEINRLQAENERLKDEYEETKKRNQDLVCAFQTYKAEAYKECIEKVKEKSKKTEIVCSGALVTISYAISNKSLDNLLKELIGE